MENKQEKENRKRRLRQNMIGSDGSLEKEDKEIEAYYAETRKRHRRIRLIILVLAAAACAALFLGYRYYRQHHVYQSFKERWEKPIAEGSFAGYEAYGENVLKYTRDGAVYLGRSGTELWNQAYEMQTPFAVTCKDYAVIADRSGYSMYICNTSGCQGVVTTTLPITKAAVSGTGVTVAILEDKKSNVIAFYDKTGTKLRIEVQTTLAGNGYPIDLAISPNGMLLAVSYVYLDQGSMQNQVVFYNFDEEGQNIKDRLVGGFKEYGTNMVAKVQFLDDETACAFAQDRLCFYSLANTVKPQLVEQVDVSSEVEKIFYSDRYAGMILAGENGKKVLQMYGRDGKKLFEKQIDRDFEKAEISGEYLLLSRAAECEIYNMSGNLKYRGAFDHEIEKLISLGRNRFMQISVQSMLEIELK